MDLWIIELFYLFAIIELFYYLIETHFIVTRGKFVFAKV